MQRSAVASCSYSRGAAAAAVAAAPAAALAFSRPAAARSSPPSPQTQKTHARATTTSLLGCRLRRRQQLNLPPLLRASASSATAEKEPPRNKTVADIMTKGVFTVTADTTVDEGAILCVDFSSRSREMPARESAVVLSGRALIFSLADLEPRPLFTPLQNKKNASPRPPRQQAHHGPPRRRQRGRGGEF